MLHLLAESFTSWRLGHSLCPTRHGHTGHLAVTTDSDCQWTRVTRACGGHTRSDKG